MTALAIEALDEQVNALTWGRSEMGERFLRAMILESSDDPGDGERIGDSLFHGMSKAMDTVLRYGDTFAVTADICAIAKACCG